MLVLPNEHRCILLSRTVCVTGGTAETYFRQAALQEEGGVGRAKLMQMLCTPCVRACYITECTVTGAGASRLGARGRGHVFSHVSLQFA